MAHADDDAQAKAQRKKDFDKYLERSAERREEVKATQREHAEAREAEESARAQRQHADVLDEERREEERKEALAEWREQEKLRKKEVEADQARRKRERELILEKQKLHEEEEKKHKEYMQTLEWSAAIDRLKKRKTMEAHEAKLEIYHEAERVAKARKEHAAQEDFLRQKEADRKGREERGEIDKEELGRFAEIEEDINQRKAKLFAKEQTEHTQLQGEWSRKRAILKSIHDSSLLQRTRDELERTEKAAFAKLRQKYQVQATALEVERTRRIDEARTDAKRAREQSTADERNAKNRSKQVNLQERLESDIEMHRRFKEGVAREKEILGMTSEEMAQASDERREKKKAEDAQK